MDRATLKRMAKEQIKGNIGILFVIILLNMLVSGGLSAIPVVGTVAGMLVSGALSLAMIDIYMGLIDGKKPEIGDLFSRLKDFWPAFKVTFFTGLYVFLWCLLLYVPGIIKACAYSQAMYIMAEDPTMGARDALKKSEEMMKGHKMEYFVMILSFFGWAILGALTLGILYIWLMPYISATFANFHKSLKETPVIE